MSCMSGLGLQPLQSHAHDLIHHPRDWPHCLSPALRPHSALPSCTDLPSMLRLQYLFQHPLPSLRVHDGVLIDPEREEVATHSLPCTHVLPALTSIFCVLLLAQEVRVKHRIRAVHPIAPLLIEWHLRPLAKPLKNVLPVDDLPGHELQAVRWTTSVEWPCPTRAGT